jgi:RNA polymerase sigma factor (sigma-70 family)
MDQTPSPPSLDELLSHMGWVRNLARGLVREEDAEDLAQETMLRAIQTPPTHSDNLRGWLAMISRNLMRSSNRKEARRAQRFDQNKPQPLEPPKPEELFYRAEMAETVRKLVDRLDDNTRYLILLRFHEERKVDDIASMLGISRRAAQSRLDRAMAKLRESMRRHLGEDYIVACLILATPVGPPLATAVPAGTGAATGGISGSGMAMILQGLMAVAALLIPIYFVAFDSDSLDPIPDSGVNVGQLEAAIATGTQQSGNTRTEVADASSTSDLAKLRLLVQDQNGLPIPEARVAARKSGGSLPNQLWSSKLEISSTLIGETEADGNGYAEIELPAAKKVGVYIGSRYFAVKRLSITTPVSGVTEDEVKVTLLPAGCVLGTISDGQSAPISDAVILLQRASRQSVFDTLSYRHRTVSDEFGGYELPSVPPGDYLLQVAHPQFERHISAPFTVTEEGNQPEFVKDVQLSHGLSITGVLDDSEGKPVAGAAIWVLDPTELPKRNVNISAPRGIAPSGYSGEDGSFQVYGWSQSRGSTILISSAGFLTKVVPNAAIADPLYVTLQRGLSLSIQVESDSQAVPAARVRLTQRIDANNASGKTKTSQENGRASFHGLAPGLYHATVSDQRGYGTTQPFELANNGQVEVLNLEHGAGFELVALDEAGKPLSNIALTLMRIDSLPNMEGDSGSGVTDQASASGKTDSLGRYNIHVRPGIWKIIAKPKGRSQLNVLRELQPNQVLHLEHSFGAVGSLAVTANGPDGTPLQGLRIALRSEEGTIQTNRADVTGRANFLNLEPGVYALFPWTQNVDPNRVPAGAVNITVNAQERAEHQLSHDFVSVPTFKVLRDGRPVKDALINLAPHSPASDSRFDLRNPAHPRTDQDGKWTSQPLRVGLYQVSLRSDENRPEQRWTFDLKSGITEHDLHLQEFTVQGKLILPAGEAGHGLQLQLERQVLASDGSVLESPHSPNMVGLVTANTDKDGNFTFSGVPSGAWQLRLRGQEWAGSSIFDVVDGSVDLGNLTVEQPCKLQLKLSAAAIKEAELGPGSKPQLELVHVSSLLRYQLYPNEEGVVERSDLPSGDYKLLFARRPATLLSLSPAQKTELNLQ